MLVYSFILVQFIAFLLFSNFSEGMGKEKSVFLRGSSGSRDRLRARRRPYEYKSGLSLPTTRKHRQIIHNEKIDKELDRALDEAHAQRAAINKQSILIDSHQLNEQWHVPYGTEDREKHLERLHAQNKELETAKTLKKASFVFQKQHPPLSQALHREAQKHRDQHKAHKAIYDAGIKTRRIKDELIPSHFEKDNEHRHQLHLEKHKALNPVWKVLEGNERYFNRKFNQKGENSDDHTFTASSNQPLTQSSFLYESENFQKKWANVLKDYEDLHTSRSMSEEYLRTRDNDRKRKRRERRV